MQIRLAENSVAPSNQVHLPSRIQFPESSLEVQQIVDLENYAFAAVNNSPTTTGIYEYWVNFDSAAVILPHDVYVVAHPSADSIILSEADQTYYYMSNGDEDSPKMPKRV